MKKNTSPAIEFATFLIIFCFFLLPPFFSPAISEMTSPFVQWNFPLQQLMCALLAIFLWIYYKEEKRPAIIKFPLIFTFSLLFFVELIFKFISVSQSTSTITETNFYDSVVLPSDFIQWSFCVINFLFSAFFEEVLYRFYLPGRLKYFASFLPNKKIFLIICEVISCLIFAFSHSYMGFLSVLNAFFAHIILRICYLTCNNIFCGTAAHFLYNIISLLLM